ncbi:penicillin-binding transpeptidase domain-containing protein [Granulicella arctica]|uniref:Cell division protein FtsI/penicillin-binding protein 2 n=1 Tax=Granulicella arctica TaxID=940613 RepID=A0A7Y9PJU9_9BACT|nr:penicillin-binding transpeptidase domain-containing protein [Granulicella arctica]NYF81181.1 cell division protein FtsI/penicillin-binding protein 2 [Granulicella arctica]
MKSLRSILLLVTLGSMVTTVPLYAKTKTHHAPVHAKAQPVRKTSTVRSKATSSRRSTQTVAVTRGRRGTHATLRRARYSERFFVSSFEDNPENLTQGDVTGGEDPTVRAAAIAALGNMNGTVLAIDPSSGRILAMVNQRLALSSGAEPCSTIKLTVAMAALEEGLIKRDTPVNLGGGYRVDLTYALAKSINPFFEVLGRTLGFERVKHYANEFGLGELAGYHIQGEQLGIYPDQELSQKLGGVGRMCSFGESISMTPLQLGAIVSAIANGGTLYYLQHPETPEDVTNFTPKVKRLLNIAPIIPEIVPGMAGAVNSSFGTARSLRSNFNEFPVMGKTGTCSNNGTRFGWFGSYADTPTGRIVTVIFLEGGRPTFGPKAAELTGEFYKALWDKSYFTPKMEPAPVTATR